MAVHLILRGLTAEFGGGEMADLGVEGRLGHDYGRTLDVIVDEFRIRTVAAVDVIESVGDIGCDLHSRNPG